MPVLQKLSFYLSIFENKGEKKKPKKQKKIIKIGGNKQNSKQENDRKTMKIFSKINKTDKPLRRLIRKKERR